MGGCWFERGALRIHLGVQEDFVPAIKAHPAFTVLDHDLPPYLAVVEEVARSWASAWPRSSPSSPSSTG